MSALIGTWNGMTRQPRVVLYSHDTMGIGHMRRNLLIAQALAAPPISATVLLIAGAREASAFAMPPGVDCLTLPSLCKNIDGQYQPRGLGVSLRDLVNLRAQTIASSLRSFKPDVFIADKEPLGALGELKPALPMLRDTNARLVLGLRDVLDEPAVVRREWSAAGNEDAIREYYDAVWIYGDPAVYDLAEDCDFSADIRAKTSFTGYLDACYRLRVNRSSPKIAPPDAPPQPYVLCTVGGGQDGAKLVETFAAATLPAGRRGVIITGPCMVDETKKRLRRLADVDRRWHVYDFHPEPCSLINRAERVVAMGGYNTVMEILGFAKSALIVPRVKPRREQIIRAARLRDLGLVDLLHPDDLSPANVSSWLAGSATPAAPARQVVDLDGLKRIPRLFRSLGKLPVLASTVEACHAN